MTAAMDNQVASIFEHPLFAAFVNYYNPFEYLLPRETSKSLLTLQHEFEVPSFYQNNDFDDWNLKYTISSPLQSLEIVSCDEDSSPPDSPNPAIQSQSHSGRKPVRVKKTLQNRVIWTKRLHSIFLAAIKHVGLNAKPKLILQVMAVEGLTRENVASHLQKYRKKLSDRKNHEEADSEDENDEEFNTNHQIDLSIISSSKQNRFKQLLTDFRVEIPQQFNHQFNQQFKIETNTTKFE